MAAPPDPYADIFRDYRVALAGARSVAERWWAGLRRPSEGEEWEERVRRRWPMGPASHPAVVAVFRHFTREVILRNAALLAAEDAPRPPADPGEEDLWGRDEDLGPLIEPPRGVLHGRLDRADPPLARFMDNFVFHPIDEDDLEAGA